MKKFLSKTLLATLTLVQGLVFTGMALAAVPPPPVNQMNWIPDTVFNGMTEMTCRYCHVQRPVELDLPLKQGSVPSRHHVLYGTPAKPDSIRPFPDGDWDGITDPNYQCTNCHIPEGFDPWTGNTTFTTFRDCLYCHQMTAATMSVHHQTADAANQLCDTCHKAINGPLDGHYVPAYAPSMITPWPSGKPNADIDPTKVSSAGTYPGNCNYCHNTADGLGGTPLTNIELTQFTETDYNTGQSTGVPVYLPVYSNADTHHTSNVAGADINGSDQTRCHFCHDVTAAPEYAIRQCEACHGPTTLHSIAVDSNGDGQILPGSETPGSSHIGHNDDCWGCHGNNGVIMSAQSAPGGAVTLPTIRTISISSVKAGSTNTVVLEGAGFTNYVRNPWTGQWQWLIKGNVRLIDDQGNATSYIPTTVTESSLEVVIPGTLPVGNYKVMVDKYNRLSNPLVLTVRPGVTIDSASCDQGVVTVTGSGFGDYVYDPNGEVLEGAGFYIELDGAAGNVTSWTDTGITAEFPSCGSNVAVGNAFDDASTTL